MSATTGTVRTGRCTRGRGGLRAQKPSTLNISQTLVILNIAIGCTTVRAGDDRFGFATHFEQGWAPKPVMQDIASTGVSYIRDDLKAGSWEPSVGVYEQPSWDMAWLNAAKAYPVADDRGTGGRQFHNQAIRTSLIPRIVELNPRLGRPKLRRK